MNKINIKAVVDPRVNFFDQLAPIWDSECSHPEDCLRRFDELKARFKLCSGQKLLEIGCGTGQITSWLAQCVHPGKVVAVDFSTEMLARAKATGAKATFERLDICHQAPEMGLFDVVFCYNAFPHFRDQSAALKNIARCLAPSGLLVVLHLSGSEKLNAFHKGLRAPICHDLLPKREQWPLLLQKAGLELSSLEDEDSLFLLLAKNSAP